MATKEPRTCKAFTPDPAIGPDWRGTRTCKNCGHLGKAGDVRHTPKPPRPAPARKVPAWLDAIHRAHDAAVLGEHDDEEDTR